MLLNNTAEQGETILRKYLAPFVAAWLGVFVSLSAYSQTDWLTIEGDGSNPAIDTVEVSPVFVVLNDQEQKTRIKVSRSTQRTSWEGIPYRSYEAEVIFNCSQNTARYFRIVFFMQPAWKGKPHKTAEYSLGTPRWMQFRNMNPNPTERIMRAVCQKEMVQST